MQSIASAFLAALLLSATPLVQPAPGFPAGDPTSSSVSGVTVTAPKKGAVQDFIWRAGSKTSDGQLARWHTDVCPSSTGLPEVYDAYFDQRLRDIAKSVKAQVATSTCTPNILIYFTPDPDKTLAGLRLKNSWMFGGENPAILASYIKAKMPIFWTHNVTPMPSDGAPGDVYCSVGRCILQVHAEFASRLQSSVVDSMGVVAVIVDTHKVKGLSFASLSSYIAMISLAQFNGAAIGPSMPTILNLFKDREGGRPIPTDLTDWDIAYLRGLYSTDADISASLQRSEIYQRLKLGPGIADDPPR
jgi:hypothetical protein